MRNQRRHSVFDEVERSLGESDFDRSFRRTGRIIAVGQIFIFTVVVLGLLFGAYSFFINPEPLAKLQGRALGTMMREADKAYNEQP